MATLVHENKSVEFFCYVQIISVMISVALEFAECVFASSSMHVHLAFNHHCIERFKQFEFPITLGLEEGGRDKR